MININNYKKNMPEELKTKSQWIIWKLNKSDHKIVGKPITKSGNGKWRNTEKFSYQEAINKIFQLTDDVNNYNNHIYEYALAYALDNDYIVIDLDGGINDDDSLEPWAFDIIEKLEPTFTEVTKSNNGLHLFYKTNDYFQDKKELKLILGNDHKGIEIFTNKKLVTMTCSIYNEKFEIKNASDALQSIYADIETEVNKHKCINVSNKKINTIYTDDNIFSQLKQEVSIFDIIRYYGFNLQDAVEYNNYKSCKIICPFHKNGKENKASCIITHSSKINGYKCFSCDDQDGGDLIKFVSKIENISQVAAVDFIRKNILKQNNKKETSIMNTTDNTIINTFNFVSDDIYFKNDWMKEVQVSNNMKRIPTGFDRLDEYLDGGIYPALTVFGAQSSMGKTTFVHQLMTNIAVQGEPVLIISLEQTKRELASKAVSRLTYQIDNLKGITPTKVEKNEGDKIVFKNACVKYSQEIAPNIVTVEGNPNTTIHDVKDIIEAYIKQFNKKPVVMLDYLQLLKSSDPKLQKRESVDYDVAMLREIVKKNGIPLITISSFNRANYQTQISFDCFKESGGIEYTADIVLGLQYFVASEFKGDKNDNKKLIRKAELGEYIKDTNINYRNLELVCLKQRNGRKFSIGLTYTPAFQNFVEMDKIQEDLMSDDLVVKGNKNEVPYLNICN